MQTLFRIKLAGYITSLLVLVLGFIILYNETNQILNSALFAALAALMVWGTFIIMRWLAQILIK